MSEKLNSKIAVVGACTGRSAGFSPLKMQAM
jgi:hypothetical protein